MFFDLIEEARKCKNVSDCKEASLAGGASVCINKKFALNRLKKAQLEALAACDGVVSIGIPVCGGGKMECNAKMGCMSWEN